MHRLTTAIAAAWLAAALAVPASAQQYRQPYGSTVQHRSFGMNHQRALRQIDRLEARIARINRRYSSVGAVRPNYRPVLPRNLPPPPAYAAAPSSQRSVNLADMVIGGLILWGMYETMIAVGGSGGGSASGGGNPIARMMEAAMGDD